MLRYRVTEYEITAYKLRYMTTEYDTSASEYDTILFWLRCKVTEYDNTVFRLQYYSRHDLRTGFLRKLSCKRLTGLTSFQVIN